MNNTAENTTRNTPKYEPDDGPLTDEQIAKIRELCPPLEDDRFTERLF